jgi:hypothetical protein
MQIWHFTRGFAPMSLVDDRPTLRSTSTGGVELEVLGRKGTYKVELTLDECRRVAEAIDYAPTQYAGHPPP